MNQMIVSLLNTLGLKSDPQTSVVFRNTVEAITQPQLDAISPIPFAMSVTYQILRNNELSGAEGMLDLVAELTEGELGEGGIQGFSFYMDIQRGSYWGDIEVTITHPETVDSAVAKETIDVSECNSYIASAFNEAPVADDEIIIAITASGGGHSITRTLTINVVADP